MLNGLSLQQNSHFLLDYSHICIYNLLFCLSCYAKAATKWEDQFSSHLQVNVLVYLFLSTDGVMRTMSTDKLLKGMPTLQSQIDALLEFDVSVFIIALFFTCS